MRIHLLFIAMIFLSSHSYASRISCTTIYDKSLCETEELIQYKSETVNWELTKDQFKEKLLLFLNHVSPGHSARIGNVFLWVNDFNSQSAFRLQVWEAQRSFILDIPSDINSVNLDTDLSVRGAGFLPYPTDFGFTLGEIIIQCQGDCGDNHRDWLATQGITNLQLIMPQMFIAQVSRFSESATIHNLIALPSFESHFRSAELSPVLEGNGFREFALVVYF